MCRCLPTPNWRRCSRRPGKVVAESTVAEIGVTEWTLSNGVHVVVKPTDFKDDQVLVRAISPGGTSLAPDKDWLSAAMASSVVSMSGAGAFSAVDLQKVLAGKAVSAGPSIGETDEGFYGSGSPKDLETLLQLIYIYATAPRTDSAAFAAMTARIRAFTANRGASPEANFQDTLQVTLAQGNPRERPLTSALVDSIDLGTAVAFYRDRFADFGDFTFFFVGNVDPATLRPLVEQWLGGLPSSGRKETWRDLGIRPPTGIVEKTVRKGLEPKARIAIIFTGPFADSRENRYALRSLGDALSIRLREVLREDMGGVYGVGASGSSQIVPDTSYSFSIGFGADPQRLDSLKAAVVTTIRAFQTAGPSDSIIEKIQETQRRARETSLRENSYWLGWLVTAQQSHVDPRGILTYEHLIDALTRTTVRDAARRYLRLDNYVEVRLVPEAGKPGT
jgi:zinc protease